jgi:hypothetical protein
MFHEKLQKFIKPCKYLLNDITDNSKVVVLVDVAVSWQDIYSFFLSFPSPFSLCVCIYGLGRPSFTLTCKGFNLEHFVFKCGCDSAAYEARVK